MNEISPCEILVKINALEFKCIHTVYYLAINMIKWKVKVITNNLFSLTVNTKSIYF